MQLLAHAHIPAETFKRIAGGIARWALMKMRHKIYAQAKAKVLEEIKDCNANNDDRLDFNEAKACLMKHAKALGLKNDPRSAKRAIKFLTKHAIIDRAGFTKFAMTVASSAPSR